MVDEAGRARAGMGIDVADLGNGGNLSIAIGNFAREPVSLYTQIRPDLFQDLAGSARLTRPTLLKLTFGLLFVDLDLDGYQDLVTANGHLEPDIGSIQQDITFKQVPQVFHNNGSGQLIDVSDRAGRPFRRPLVARSLASADIDRDGDPDLLITVNGGRPRLLRNDLGRANWIGLRPLGNPPNRDAIGAVVTVWTNGMAQRRMVRTSSSYLSQSSVTPLMFGLGPSAQADSLSVCWPTSGLMARYGPAPAGRVYAILEDRPGGLQAEPLAAAR